MANKLASPIFQTGPKDALATLDVYTSTGKDVINSIQALTNTSSLNIGGLLGSLTGANAAFGGLLKSVKGKIAIDKDALAKRLIGAIPSVASGLRDLTSNLKAGVLGSMADLGSLQATVGGLQTTLSSANFADVSAFGGLMGNLTLNMDAAQQFNLVDKDAFSGIISGAIAEGAKLGMPSSFSTLTTGLTLGNNPLTDDVLNRVVAQSMPTLLKEGDFRTLLDMSSSSVGKNMGVVMPDFAQQITQTYSRKYNGQANDLFDDHLKVLQTLTNVNADWDKVVRNSEEGTDDTINLLSLLGSSRDFRALIAAGISNLGDHDRQKYYALHGLYEETTVEAEIKRYFPRVAVMTATQRKATKDKKTYDIRTIVDLAGLATAVGAPLLS